MRGVTLNDMRSTYAQGAIPPLTGYEPIMEPSSPTSAWQIPHSIIPKEEPMDQEERNDSGISGSYLSSESDRSENVRYSPPNVSSPMYGQAIGVPKLNSHSKVKQFKCKKCEYVTISQTAFWEHQKSHLKKDKMLSCMRCPFVTEFKHHFEYHMRNHTGYKPFKCTQCNYACVNKSMLNSHLKSHSEVYQYACSDCRYVTKYMHSLKIHLRKYKHNPAMVRNPDGTPNPLSIIDVYGTRRGSRIRLQEQKTVQEDLPQPKPTAASFPFNPFMLNAPQIPFQQLPFLAGSPAAIPNAFLFQNLETLIKRYEELTRENQNDPKENQENPLPENNYDNPPEQSQREDKVLDLSKPTEQALRKNRRKGRPFRVAPEDINHREHEELTHIFNSV